MRAALPKEGSQKFLGQGLRRFAGDEAVQHFSKHADEVMKALGKRSYNLAEYVADANHVIQTGQWVPELNAYVKLVGGRVPPRPPLSGSIERRT